MYYKTLPSTATYKALAEVFETRKKHLEKCRELAKTFGAKALVHQGSMAVGFHFENEPDRILWRPLGKSWQRFYAPKKNNLPARQSLSNLPEDTSKDTMNEILGFEPQWHGMSHTQALGVHFIDGKCILIEVPNECTYQPPSDVEEIKGSEYEELRKQSKDN